MNAIAVLRAQFIRQVIYFEWIAENLNLMRNLILTKKFLSEISLILSCFFLTSDVGVIFLR